MKRLAQIAKTEIVYPDGVRAEDPTAAEIVGAGIIANAIKEAAPVSKPKPPAIDVKPIANGAPLEAFIADCLRRREAE